MFLKDRAMHRPYIMVAPNGARRMKQDHPALPLTTDDLIDTARTCAAAGAQAMHVHIRDSNGKHSLDPGQYRETMQAIGNAVPDLRLQITTESAGLFDVQTQLTCIAQVRPDWVSVSIREIARDPDLAPKVYATCADHGCTVQHILYGPDDQALLADWRAKGIVAPDQTDMLFVLGRYSVGQVSAPQDLDAFLETPPAAGTWMVCAFGPQEHACLTHAAAHGGSLRVGFENSLTDTNEIPHKDNAASIRTLLAELDKVSL